MKDKKLIDQEVEKTLTYLTRMEEIKANPFLFQKVKARLEAQERGRISVPQKILKFSPVFLVVFIILNVFSTIYVFSSYSRGTDVRNNYITALAKQYGFVQSSSTTWLVNK